MKLFLKYMVSLRCKILVKAELEKLSLHWITVDLGQVVIKEDITAEMWSNLDAALRKSGIELIADKKSILIEKIKILIIKLVHYSEEPLQVNLSDYLQQELQRDYAHLANLFSGYQGITIEHFYIMHKVERVKELLMYDELNISEIAWQMHYSSVAHLSAQFKKITGLSPTIFKKLQEKNRFTLEDI